MLVAFKKKTRFLSWNSQRIQNWFAGSGYPPSIAPWWTCKWTIKQDKSHNILYYVAKRGHFLKLIARTRSSLVFLWYYHWSRHKLLILYVCVFKKPCLLELLLHGFYLMKVMNYFREFERCLHIPYLDVM